jgi:hypothetical protein
MSELGHLLPFERGPECPLLTGLLPNRYPKATLNAACWRRTIDRAAISAPEHSLRWSADAYAQPMKEHNYRRRSVGVADLPLTNFSNSSLIDNRTGIRL